jgi:hypothetical protein
MEGSSTIGRDLKGSDFGIIEYYSGICLETLKKTTKYLRYDSLYTGRDSNIGIPRYKYKYYSYTRPHDLGTADVIKDFCHMLNPVIK